MNPRNILFSILVMLAGFAIWKSLHTEQEPTALPLPAAELENKQEKATADTSRFPAQATEPSEVHSTASSAAIRDARRYIQNVKADPQYDWKQPINFYGKVLDESNQPISGATVNFAWNDLSQTGSAVSQTMSDGAGLFSLLNRTGKRLFVDVSKIGYHTSKRNGASFEYANPADGLFTPESANPVVFHLHKKGKAEPLIHGLKLFGIRVDGTLSYVDLVEATNKLTPPGDLTAQCTRSQPNADKKFDWTFTLGVPEGGIIEATNEFAFLAPEEGYQPSYQMAHKAHDPDWVDGEKRKFFVKSRNGMHLRLRPNHHNPEL